MKRLTELGHAQPTPVQRLVIPPLLSKKDVVFQAETGSGKTLSYLLPLIALRPQPNAKAVIVVPTQELAVQTLSVLMQFLQKEDIPHAHMCISGPGEEEAAIKVRERERLGGGGSLGKRVSVWEGVCIYVCA